MPNEKMASSWQASPNPVVPEGACCSNEDGAKDFCESPTKRQRNAEAQEVQTLQEPSDVECEVCDLLVIQDIPCIAGDPNVTNQHVCHHIGAIC